MWDYSSFQSFIYADNREKENKTKPWSCRKTWQIGIFNTEGSLQMYWAKVSMPIWLRHRRHTKIHLHKCAELFLSNHVTSLLHVSTLYWNMFLLHEKALHLQSFACQIRWVKKTSKKQLRTRTGLQHAMFFSKKSGYWCIWTRFQFNRARLRISKNPSDLASLKLNYPISFALTFSLWTVVPFNKYTLISALCQLKTHFFVFI